jgi:hypothetical protein
MIAANRDAHVSPRSSDLRFRGRDDVLDCES